MKMKQRINADFRGLEKLKTEKNVGHKLVILSVLICVNPLLLFSCSTMPTDMRSLAPADSLIYLETNDLAAALQPIVDSKPFNEVAKSKPDFSALKGVQLAVAVTGFETSEEQIDEEQFVGRIQPHFVAIADTHAWNFQAVGFAEKKLGSFVENIYNSEPTLEKTDKHGGKYFTWTAADGRKAYALVLGAVIYFGNDESSIDKCLAVRRGESLNMAQTERVRLSDAQTLASGYVSTDGVAQIANIVGLQLASEASDEPEVQSAVAGIVPQLLRNSITEIRWTATNTDKGIEDEFLISLQPEVAKVFYETMAPSDSPDFSLVDYLPQDISNVTLYNLKNPQIAWRSLILTAQKQTDPLAGKIIAEFSSIFFEPYGIRDPEMFLLSAKQTLVTAKCDAEGEQPVVLIKTSDSIKESILSTIKPRPDRNGIEGAAEWISDDKDLTTFFDGRTVISGDTKCVESLSVHSYLGESDRHADGLKRRFGERPSSIATLGIEQSVGVQIVDVLSEPKSADAMASSQYFTETRFTKIGMERKTISDFGLIASIIAQLAQD